MNNNDAIEKVSEEGHVTGPKAEVSVPAVASCLTVDLLLVVARRACMVAELDGLATMTIQLGLQQLAQMAGHISTIVGVLQDGMAASRVLDVVIPELLNYALPEAPVTD